MRRAELESYFELLKSFHVGETTADQFEARYLALFKTDQRLFPNEIFNVLNQLFSDVDVFVADPKIRGNDDLDEQQLRACAHVAYERLLRLVHDQ